MSTDTDNTLQRLVIKYGGIDDGPILPANGIVGHVLPTDQHSIFFTLYQEYITLPADAFRTVEGSALGPEQFVGIPEGELWLTRKVVGRYVVPASKARDMARWLLQKADESDASTKPPGV